MIRLLMNPALASFSTPLRMRPCWDLVEVVLLDMDGTLLDLQFDNHFWLQLVPERFALRHSLTLQAARQLLAPRFAAKQGTLDWYCTDFWTRELGLDIAALKREVREQVRFLPGAEQFLAELRRRGLRTVLITNAHRDSLEVKAGQTNLIRYFDAVVSSHEYGVPKESAAFWPIAQQQLGFDPPRSLFVDDNLAVLRAAQEHGIAQVFAVSRPDSGHEARQISDFPAVASIIDLLA
jgi:5'-nucleotidase